MIKIQKAALLTTAFSLFMLVVYENKTGAIVNYKRMINETSCLEAATPSRAKAYYHGEAKKRGVKSGTKMSYYENAKTLGVKDDGFAYDALSFGIKCVPLSQWN